MKSNLIVVTNGFKENWQAIVYATGLAKAMQSQLTLIGIVATDDEKHPVEEMFSRALELFHEQGISYQLEIYNGELEKVISQADKKHKNAIFIVGRFGRSPMQKMFSGSSLRDLMATIQQPILFVPKESLPLNKILLCTGGLRYALTAENLGLQIAAMTNASLTILMVVPQIDMNYPESKTIREQWQTLDKTDTLPGRNLRNALQVANDAGVQAEIKVRNGNIVEEILDEIRTTDYDLVCMGSPYSSQSLRQLYSANVTADVAETGLVPVLSARFEEQD